MSKTKRLKIASNNIEIPNWDKILFPQIKLKKSDIIEFYDKISEKILPFLQDRVITLHRFPDGIEHEGFYQKKYQDHYPTFIPKQTVRLADGDKQTQIICQKKADLIYLVGQGVIEFHIWLCKKQHLGKANRLLFDIDPPSSNKNAFQDAIKACVAIKTALQQYHLTAYVMTTGSKGLHVVTPIRADHDFDTVRTFAKKIAKEIVEKDPNRCTLEVRKAQRKQRVFIDYTRNAYGQTTIAPYSLRAKPEAPIATPVRWDELDDLMSSQTYTIDNIFRRLAHINDPWQGFADNPSILTKSML